MSFPLQQHPPNPSEKDAIRPTAPGVSHGLIWLLASYGVMGISGVGLTFIIARLASPGNLGVFHQAMALYFFLSQLTTWGQQHSILRHLPLHHTATGACLWGALVNAIVFASLGTLLLSVTLSPLALAFGSPALGKALSALLPAIWLFPITKVLMFALNATQRMAAYAIGNSIRYLMLPLGAWAWLYSQQPAEQLTTIMMWGEIALLMYGCWQWKTTLFQWPNWRDACQWCATHRRFGQQSMVAGMVSDINTRIDIIVLGLLGTDTMVGLYSIVATIIEGLIQLLTVFRTAINPLLAQASDADRHPNGWQHINEQRHKSVWLVPLLLSGSGLIWYFYPWGVSLLQLSPVYVQAQNALGIVLLGVSLSASHLPFSLVLQQCGHPLLQTLQVSNVALINTVGNLMLIPILGLPGAAVATTLAYLAMALQTETAIRWCQKPKVLHQ